jgi:hypothetical protein
MGKEILSRNYSNKHGFILIMIICTFYTIESHYIKKIIHPASKVTGYTNQSQ